MGRPVEFNNRLGEINYTKYKSKLIITEYINCDNIKVSINDNYTVNTTYNCFKKGNIKYPYDKSVYNAGYLGEGVYNRTNNNLVYNFWHDMLKRCFDNKTKEKEPTYITCGVCKEWLNFQNFAKWFEENYYLIEKERVELDKDILHKKNKLYSPNNCIFVPHRINKLFIKCDASRGKYPIGVSYYKKYPKFMATCCIIKNNKPTNKNLGYFDTPEDAFYLGYKPFKEKYIKQVAEEYKDKIPNKLYNAMMDWKVEIAD
jgi:hypothetical protein